MKNGFTLIELLVVLVIVAMASAFVAPRFFAPMGNLQLKTAAKKIAGTMRYSRSLAVAEKDNRVCVFDFDDHQVSVFKGILPDADDDADGFSESLPEIQYDLPEKVFLQKAVAGDAVFENGKFRVVFFANGSASGGDITLTNDRNRSCVIHVDFITGMVTMPPAEVAG